MTCLLPVRQRSPWLLTITLGLVLMFPASPAAGSDGARGEDDPEKRLAPGPLCGIYCIHIAARAVGRDIDMATLINDKYIGDRTGSSIAELRRALADVGLYAAPMKNMQPDDLRNLKIPAILYVRSDVGTILDHYVVYLGDVRGKAACLDPASGLHFVDYQLLPATWSGSAILVSDTLIDPTVVTSTGRMMWDGLAMFAIVLAGGGARLLLRKSCHRWRLMLCEAGIVLLIASVICGFQHVLGTFGLLRNGKAVALVVASRIGAFLETTEPEDISSWIRKGAVIVDARFPADYEAGHIGQAINVPPTTSAEDRRSRLKHADKRAPVILYCQGPQCNYAERVAKRLYLDGFGNLVILRGGWLAWSYYESARMNEARK